MYKPQPRILLVERAFSGGLPVSLCQHNVFPIPDFAFADPFDATEAGAMSPRSQL